MSGVEELLDLSGESALVTGANGGIGRGIAKRLEEAGAEIILHSKSDMDNLDDFGEGAISVEADLSSEEEIDVLVANLKDAGKLPTLLVNNAGLQPVSSLAETTGDEWSDIHDVNLKGVFLLTQKICNQLVSCGKEGAIVNIASIEALDPAVGHAHYATSKAGLIMFTRSAALEYGAHGIRVNSVSPGLIYRDELEANWPEGVSSWKSNAPLGRLGTPDDIANAVLFLLSPAASWITGSNLVVDGGMTASPRW